MTQRQVVKKNPIVIVNNQNISNTTSPVVFGNDNQEDDLDDMVPNHESES